jgi:hypothetical protein
MPVRRLRADAQAEGREAEEGAPVSIPAIIGLILVAAAIIRIIEDLTNAAATRTDYDE